METIDEITKRKINLNKRGVHRIAVCYAEDQLVYGYTRHVKNLPSVVFYFENGDKAIHRALIENFTGVFYSPKDNHYHCSKFMPEKEMVIKRYHLPPGVFPYSFQKKYEAVDNFELFYDKQINSTALDFPISKVFKYSFGLEFETSMGAIPEVDCFQAGLIPLRDGSISGIEYATVKLDGVQGFNLLNKQLQLLREYTHFNKDCSLHVHMGGFPMQRDKLWNLYRIIQYVQSELQSYLPRDCFHTANFKSNGKDYCNKLPRYDSFDDLFMAMTGHKFLGSFTQPHPNDITRERKWNIPQRYYMCNFINMFCYKVNKTIEFRFLTPTFNMEKILTWLYIFNGILLYAENYPFYRGLELREIFGKVYPKEVYSLIMNQLNKLYVLQCNQTNNGDFIGADYVLEDKIFGTDKII